MSAQGFVEASVTVLAQTVEAMRWDGTGTALARCQKCSMHCDCI